MRLRDVFGSVLVATALLSSVRGQESMPVVALVGPTVIDGNGGPPLADATILISGSRIAAVGPRATVQVPSSARIIDAAGKFATPGFVDTNVHVGPLNDETTFARYWDRLPEIILQASQLHLKYGVTTIRDSYGPLPALIQVRDAIARGTEIGPRLYVAGNVIGWGGPYSDSFSRTRESSLTLFQEEMNDLFTQRTGEDLMHLTPDELRVAMNQYLDKGPDFIKFAGTWHINYPTLIAFSSRAQQVIVDETHKRGLIAETHSTTLEGLWMSIMAGIDLIQHPEVVGHRELTDELVDLIVQRRIICSMLPNKYTGKIWQDSLKKQEGASTDQGEERPQVRRRPKTSTEIRREQEDTGLKHPGTPLISNLGMRRVNGIKLIRSGAVISVGADNVVGIAPEFRRTEKTQHLEPGIGTIIAIEGLVELGMTPADAIVAATKNGALASKALDRLGTLEPGKFADILLLNADPLQSISNIRKLEMVMKEGQIVDLKNLPTRPVFAAW